MRKYDLVIFDMDGTLVDSRQLHEDMFNEFWRMFYPEYTDCHHPKGHLGQTLHSIFRDAGIPEHKLDEVFDTLDQYYIEHADHIIAKFRIIPGAIPVITTLREQGVHVALISNSMSALVNKIAASNHIAETFDMVVGAHRDSKDKQERFGNILESTGIAANRTLYVGDSELDVIAAHASNMDSCILYSHFAWVTSARNLLEEYKPEMVITNIETLEKIVL